MTARSTRIWTLAYRIVAVVVVLTVLALLVILTIDNITLRGELSRCSPLAMSAYL